jgi:hypothetical protein
MRYTGFWPAATVYNLAQLVQFGVREEVRGELLISWFSPEFRFSNFIYIYISHIIIIKTHILASVEAGGNEGGDDGGAASFR